MKYISHIANTISLVFFTLCFSQCVNTKNAMEVSKTIYLSDRSISQVYYQNWVAGIRGGGSGTNLFIAQSLLVDKKPIKAYFKGKSTSLELVKKNEGIYCVAYFKGELNQLKDYIMDTDAIQEHGNEVPIIEEVFPFDLLENEAVISYKENNKLKYIKLTNISEKEMLAYPSAPKN